MTKRKKRAMKRNFVAKYARQFNKAAVHRDRKKDYKRKAKHARRDYE